MSTEQPISIEEFHRQLATDLFNGVWALLEKENRNCSENDRMIHGAHASRFHWEFAGSIVNIAIGEWQCARVHTVMGHLDAALYHARRYLESAEDYQLGPFHEGFAHEAFARLYASKDPEKAGQHLQKARAAAELISEPEQRQMLEKDLETIQIAKAAGAE